MNAEEFEKATGFKPVNDDLDRANCKAAGSLGHHSCGVCEHGRPVFTCFTCFEKPRTEVKRLGSSHD